MTKSLPDLERVRRLDDEFGLFAELDTAAVCGELARDPLHGPLAGKVIGLKANIACAGAPWSAGLAHRADINALTDAHVTARLRAAGARVLPGLNMDAAALGGTTENPHFGATRNPLATAFSAGGSSGGSGAAVAAGLVDVAIGTDTLGSIRIPAAYCGLYGLKPTFGLIGRSGIVPLAPSLDCAGPLCASSHATSGRLCARLQVLTPMTPTASLAPQGWDGSEPTPSMTGLRIGVPEQVDEVACEPESSRRIRTHRGSRTTAGRNGVWRRHAGVAPGSLAKSRVPDDRMRRGGRVRTGPGGRAIACRARCNHCWAMAATSLQASWLQRWVRHVLLASSWRVPLPRSIWC